ncbi:MAG: hypothetical protein QOJ29_68 [Thermoleophilaceae bacterium]|nr:hypothetical protein [Thermoleophilaceae bacterium]
MIRRVVLTPQAIRDIGDDTRENLLELVDFVRDHGIQMYANETDRRCVFDAVEALDNYEHSTALGDLLNPDHEGWSHVYEMPPPEPFSANGVGSVVTDLDALTAITNLESVTANAMNWLHSWNGMADVVLLGANDFRVAKTGRHIDLAEHGLGFVYDGLHVAPVTNGNYRHNDWFQETTRDLLFRVKRGGKDSRERVGRVYLDPFLVWCARVVVVDRHVAQRMLNSHPKQGEGFPWLLRRINADAACGGRECTVKLFTCSNARTVPEFYAKIDETLASLPVSETGGIIRLDVSTVPVTAAKNQDLHGRHIRCEPRVTLELFPGVEVFDNELITVDGGLDVMWNRSGMGRTGYEERMSWENAWGEAATHACSWKRALAEAPFERLEPGL